MLERILTRLFGDELRAKNEAVVMNDKQPEKKLYDDPDLNILAERYGELKPGKEIMIELGAAANMLGRKSTPPPTISYEPQMYEKQKRGSFEPLGVEYIGIKLYAYSY